MSDYECSPSFDDLEKIEEIIGSIIYEEVTTHLATLNKMKRQSCYKDDFGIIREDKWLSQFNYFCNNIVYNRIEKAIGIEVSEMCLYGGDTATMLQPEYTLALINVLNESQGAEQEEQISHEELENADPYQFEALCAEVLASAGWEAAVTKGSGDNGIDIKAKKNGTYAVFQCKKYNSPVGMKAVQEILAGKVFEEADIAYVVSNAGFTDQAKMFASATGVSLLHYTELVSL
jgi:restriction system protein